MLTALMNGYDYYVEFFLASKILTLSHSVKSSWSVYFWISSSGYIQDD